MDAAAASLTSQSATWPPRRLAPALEPFSPRRSRRGALDPRTALTTAERSIVGFHRDERGDWVAELSCGHAQHIRHRPPFELRAWVLDDDARLNRVGTLRDCPLCDREPPDEH